MPNFRGRLHRLGRWSKRDWPYLALLFMVALPLWVMAVSLAARTHIFKGDVTPEKLKAFLIFIAGGLGASATVFGALLTREHNDRERWRQQLEAAMKGLEFLPFKERSGRLEERSAAIFSAMVLLGHQHVAIRILEPAWRHKQVDRATATWVIGQILAGQDPSLEGRHASEDTMTEAAWILLRHAEDGELTDRESDSYFFPGHFMHAWRTDYSLPDDAKIYLLAAMAETLAGETKDWWTYNGKVAAPRWPENVWQECAKHETCKDAKRSANALLALFRECFDGEQKANPTTEEGLPESIQSAMDDMRRKFMPAKIKPTGTEPD